MPLENNQYRPQTHQRRHTTCLPINPQIKLHSDSERIEPEAEKEDSLLHTQSLSNAENPQPTPIISSHMTFLSSKPHYIKVQDVLKARDDSTFELLHNDELSHQQTPKREKVLSERLIQAVADLVEADPNLSSDTGLAARELFSLNNSEKEIKEKKLVKVTSIPQRELETIKAQNGSMPKAIQRLKRPPDVKEDFWAMKNPYSGKAKEAKLDSVSRRKVGEVSRIVGVPLSMPMLSQGSVVGVYDDSFVKFFNEEPMKKSGHQKSKENASPLAVKGDYQRLIEEATCLKDKKRKVDVAGKVGTRVREAVAIASEVMGNGYKNDSKNMSKNIRV